VQEQKVLLARQPICDVNREIVAYELLYRFNDGRPPIGIDEDEATSQVLINAFNVSGVESITGGVPAFVNFTDNLLNILPPIDPQLLYIEILENIEVTPELIEKVKELKHLNYKIVVDDFIWDDKYKPLLELTDIVKLEVPAMSRNQLKTTIINLAPYDVELLAEKVETMDEFLFCKKLGCSLFQGFFLYKPQLMKGNQLTSNKLPVLKLMAELQNPDASVPEISGTITRDAALSFKLLKLINSAEFRRSVEVTTISTAVSLLGINRLKSWACLLAMTKLEDKPKSLLLASLQRAEFCEQIANKVAPDQADQFYMIGMLSCLELFFDVTIESVVHELPLAPDSIDALISRRGLAGLALDTALKYEKYKLTEVQWSKLQELDLKQPDLNTIFINSTEKARGMLADL